VALRFLEGKNQIGAKPVKKKKLRKRVEMGRNQKYLSEGEHLEARKKERVRRSRTETWEPKGLLRERRKPILHEGPC